MYNLLYIRDAKTHWPNKCLMPAYPSISNIHPSRENKCADLERGQHLGAVGPELHNLTFSATFRTIFIFAKGIILQKNLILQANFSSAGSWKILKL